MTLYLAFIALFLVLWAIVAALLPLAWRLVRALAGRVTRGAARLRVWSRWQPRVTRFRAYAPVALVVLIGAAVTAFAGDEFLDLAELVHAKSPQLQRIDGEVHDWAVAKRNTSATPFFVAVTNAGGPVGSAVVVVIVAIVLAIRKRWRWLLYLAVTCGGGALLNLELKRFFARARPDVAEMLRLAHGYSFPSGHAMGAMVVYGALGYLAFRIIPRWRWKSAAVALAITIIVAVSLSRIYLGVHWISDVGAGLVAGATWVTVTTVAYETMRRIRGMRVVRGEAEPERDA